MKRDWSRFAPLGLVLAGLAAFIAVCIYIVVPKWSIWLQISLVVLVIGLVSYVALAPGQLRQAIKGRRLRYGLNAAVMSLAFLGILAVVNYLVFYNAKMNPEQTRWDLTEDRSNTLAPETLDTLSKLPEAVHAQAFYLPQGSESAISSARNLLEKYAKNAKGKFSFEFIDWEKKPSLATQAGITNDGQVVLTMGDRKELVSVVSDQELTSALVRLLSLEKRTVYFLQDEGENNPNGTDDDSMSRVRDALEDKNYSVLTLKLAVDNFIPRDASVIVIASPKQPLSQKSVDLLAGYLQNGGSLILMEGPGYIQNGVSLVILGGPMIDSSGAFTVDPLANYLAQTWGVTLGNDFVITQEANEKILIAKAGAYGDHLITQKMGAYTPAFPLARSVQITTSPDGLNQKEIVYTTPYYANCFPSCSWVTTDLIGLVAWFNGVQTDPPQTNRDLKGPIPIAVAEENQATNARLVVFGSSDFAINRFRTPGNQDLLLNAIDWSVKQEQLINLTPKAATERNFVSSVIKYSNISTNLIFLGSVILLPGAVIFAGVIAWVVRRRRG